MSKVVGIRKITPQNGSKTVAFVDLEFGGILIRSFRLVDFDGNMQLQPPSRPATDKEKAKGFKKDYAYTCQWSDLNVKQALLDEAIAVYNTAA